MGTKDYEGGAVDLLGEINSSLKSLISMLTEWHGKKRRATEQDAIAALIQIGPKMSQISERTGLHKSSLYRMKSFMVYYRRAQGMRRPVRGFRTASGGLEAVADAQGALDRLTG